MDVFFLVVGADELDADEDQQDGSDGLQEGNLEEPGHDKGHDERIQIPAAPYKASPLLQMLRQILGGHADDDGIIAA